MKRGQSKRMSLIETWSNIIVGFGINFTANLIILPLFGFNITISDNLIIGVLYTGIALVRGYGLRRVFNYVYVQSEAK